MRAALATTALAAGLVLGGPALVAPAYAVPPTTGVDVDEPLEQDGEQDTGKWGLVGLTGMLGLFGYKKYRDRTSHRGTPVGGIDTDGSGSRRV